MSRYDVLKRVEPKAGAEKSPAPGSRRGNPHYRQFSAYVPLDLYLKLKSFLAGRDLDLSEAIEEAIKDWLAKQTT